LYSVGKIPGGFIKREGRPTEKAILTSRLIDRPLRPLFPKGFYNDVQVVATVLSVEQDAQPDILAMIGSSLALSISEAPFAGPTGAVSVGIVDGEFVINPDSAQREKSVLQLTVAGTKDAVKMVEAGANEVSEEKMLNAILYAHGYIKQVVDFIEKIASEVGKPKLEVPSCDPDPVLKEKVRAYAFDKVEWSLDTFDRKERETRSAEVKQETFKHFAEEYPDSEGVIDGILYNLTKEVVRDKIINRGIRPDGRKFEEIRPIWCEVGLFGRTHGSAVFTRGQTQVLTVATLGTVGDGQTLDGIGEEEFKRYMHQYNMPPYSVGETRMMRGPGRREIGHGALAERALVPVLPDEQEFPYAMRLVSEVISSNGSTSQASICASTMALMDAGVPIKKPVAGVAMGLVKDESNGNIAIMTDIQGLEDFLGDMDFKVAGTRDGITAIQMDIKIKGINEQILTRALEQDQGAVMRQAASETGQEQQLAYQCLAEGDLFRVGSGGEKPFQEAAAPASRDGYIHQLMKRALADQVQIECERVFLQIDTCHWRQGDLFPIQGHACQLDARQPPGDLKAHARTIQAAMCGDNHTKRADGQRGDNPPQPGRAKHESQVGQQTAAEQACHAQPRKAPIQGIALAERLIQAGNVA
jgi:polyribonucleotide nucleotidyltransferase